MKIDEYRKLKKKKSKMRNVQTVIDGIKFPSKKEAGRYPELILLEKAGEIKDLRRQVPYPLYGFGDAPLIGINDKGNEYHIKYIADFCYVDNRTKKFVVEDAKGRRTDLYKLKKACMWAMGIEITEV